MVVGGLGAGYGVSVWIVVPLVVAGLTIVSLPKYIDLWPKARAVGAEREWFMTVAMSLLNSLAAACAVFVAGRLAWWMWGV